MYFYRSTEDALVINTEYYTEVCLCDVWVFLRVILSSPFESVVCKAIRVMDYGKRVYNQNPNKMSL